MNCQAVLDVVAPHRVVVLHDLSSENQTQLLGLSLKLFGNKGFELLL